ncbi:hypothetical protein QE152_g22973 [Popillia japonica]|uniref:Uncharacterized protein n=1 Tax=Popillia japonica TaxID=7064 RepID=A0AAW1KJ69_POPJA
MYKKNFGKASKLIWASPTVTVGMNRQDLSRRIIPRSTTLNGLLSGFEGSRKRAETGEDPETSEGPVNATAAGRRISATKTEDFKVCAPQ